MKIISVQFAAGVWGGVTYAIAGQGGVASIEAGQLGPIAGIWLIGTRGESFIPDTQIREVRVERAAIDPAIKAKRV